MNIEHSLPQGYISLKQAAAESGLNVSRLQQLSQNGTIDAIKYLKVGSRRCWCVPLDQVVKLKVEHAKVITYLPEGYMDIHEVAENSSLTLSWLGQLARNGTIGAIKYVNDKLNSCWCVPLNQVLKLKVEHAKVITYLPEGFISLQEATKKSDINLSQLGKLARNGTIGAIKYLNDKFRYSWCVPLDQVLKLKVEVDNANIPSSLPKGYIAIQEAAEMSSFNVVYLRELSRKGTIGAIWYLNKKSKPSWCIPLEEILKLKDKKAGLLPFLPEGYVEVKKVKELLGLNTNRHVHYLLTDGTFPGALKYSKGKTNFAWGIPLAEVIKYKEKFEILSKEYMTCKATAKYLKMSEAWVHELINQNMFGEVLKLFTFYIKKTEVIRFKENRDHGENCYISSKDVMQLLKIDRQQLSRLRDNGLLGELITIPTKGGYYYKRPIALKLKEEFDRRTLLCDQDRLLLEEKVYITPEDIATFTRFSVRRLTRTMNKGDFGEIIKLPTVPDSQPISYVRKESVLKWIAQKSQADPFFTSYGTLMDPVDLFNKGFYNLEIAPNIKGTVDKYISFTINSLKSSSADIKALSGFARKFVYIFKSVSKKATKELYLYSDDELDLLINELRNEYGIDHFCKFLQHLKSNQECAYQKDFYFVPNTSPDTTGKEIDTACYTSSEWLEFHRIARDIDSHVDEAISDRVYASAFLYISVLLMNALRHTDLKLLPCIEIKDLGITSLEYFKHNRLNDEQAEKILLRIRRYGCVQSYAHKTDCPIDFFCSGPFIKPMATAYAICQLHEYIAHDGSVINFGTTYNDISVSTFNRILRKDPSFRFSVIKAARSLETYLWHQTKDKRGLGYTSIRLNMRIRGHKPVLIRRYKAAVQYYIAATSKGIPLDKSSVAVCDREEFGFMFYLITKGARKHGKALTITEETSLIKELQVKLDPVKLEQFSKFMLTIISNKITLAKLYLSKPKEELLQIQDNLILEKLPSRQLGNQCAIYPRCNTFNSSSCNTCLVAVCRASMLQSLSDETYETIGKIVRETNYWESHRDLSKLAALYDRINEALKTFGKSKLKAYFNFEEFPDLLERCEKRVNILKSIDGVEMMELSYKRGELIDIKS